MKRLFYIGLVAIAAIALSSCMSSKKTAEPAAQTAAVQASQTSSDEWWDNPPANTKEVAYVVGSAKGSTNQISRDWAQANANQKMAEYVSNTVDGITTTYVNDAGTVSETGNNMQALQAFERVSKQHAQATLTGMTYKYHTMADGTVYVLASLPIGDLAEQFKAEVREAFVKNDAAQEANDMMNAAIDKYFSK